MDLNDAIGDAHEHLTVTVRDAVATVELRRPARRNAISWAMWQALPRIMGAIAADPAVRAVVLTGAPDGPFSAGADLHDFPTRRADPPNAAAYDAAMVAAADAIQRLPIPTIAAVEQYALGGGTMLALACDLRICGADAQFAITASTLGIVYPVAPTARLVDVVGTAWARWILFTGQRVNAPTAERIGLVHQVVPTGTTAAHAADLAHRLAGQAQTSIRGTAMILDRIDAGLRDEDDTVRAVYQDAWTSPEYQERALSRTFFDTTMRGNRPRP